MTGAGIARPGPEAFSAPAKEAYKTLPVPKASELEACFRGTFEGGPPGVPGFLYWRKFCAEGSDILRPGEVIGLGFQPRGKDQSSAVDPAGVGLCVAVPFADTAAIRTLQVAPTLEP